MKKYITEVRDLTDQFIFGSLMPVDWGKGMEDITVKYIGTSFLEGLGAESLRELSDKEIMALDSLLTKHLSTIDDLTDEAYSTNNPYAFKSKALVTVLSLKSAWILGTELR